MDNRKFDITSEGEEHLKFAMRLAWEQAKGGKATHCQIYQANELGTKVPTLVLLWHEEGDASALHFPLSLDGATSFVMSWLEVVEYGPEPDHDGDNHRGWRVFNNIWGYVGKFTYGILGVQPAWAMYGK